MAVNWGLGVMPDMAGNALAAFRTGQQERQQIDHRNALLDLQRKESERDDQRWQAEQGDMAEKAKERGRKELTMIGRLLDHVKDEPTYQQALNVARRYQLPIDGVPPTFDPNWVAETRLLNKLAMDNPEALSAMGKQAIDMGFQPGTPEFATAVRDIWVAGESKPYVVGGETRLYQPKIGGAGRAVGSPPPEAVNELRQNPATAAQFDEIFGQGAAARILGQGGGGGNVTSNFLDGIELRPGG